MNEHRKYRKKGQNKMRIMNYMLLVLSLMVMDIDLAWMHTLKNAQVNALQKPNALKIIGGVEVRKHSLPYQAALIVNGNHFCGGAIISVRYILTAAHCTYSVKYIQAILGAHKWTDKESSQQIYTSTNFITHKNFNGVDRIQDNDIALVKLGPILLTSCIKPIKLVSTSNSDFVGNEVVFSGWGSTSSASGISAGLRKVYLTIAENEYCQSFYNTVKINSTQICTKEYDTLIGNVGGCYGDSGGPLVKKNELIGILSFGATNCDAGKPSIYTKISAYRNWIRSHSGI